MELTPNLLTFGVLGGIAAAGAVGVVAFPNAVRSALSLVMTFFALAFLYFTLGAEILGVSQIVVYTGAIMVLFIFVIMLLNLGSPQKLNEKQDPKMLMAGVLGLGMFALILMQVLVPLQAVVTPHGIDGYGAPPPVGRTLFTLYAYPLEIASILLVIGIVGSILLAKRKL